MPSALAPHPTLSPPVILGSYTPSPASTRAGASSFQTQSASSSRTSYAALGEVVRVSVGSSTVRRARGLVSTLAAGHSVSLVDTATHVAVQSFPLAQNAQPCTPPLTVIRGGGGGGGIGSDSSSLRTTYLGVAAQPSAAAAAATEIWAWTEVVNNKQRSGDASANAAPAPASPTRLVARCEGHVTSLHALASGQVLLISATGDYHILTHGDGGEGQDAAADPSSLVIKPCGETSPSTSRFITHSISVLDPAASAQLFGGRLPRDDVQATIISFTSKARAAATPNDATAASSTPKPKASATAATTTAGSAKRGRRKTAMEVIDDAEDGDAGNAGGSASSSSLVAFGELSVQVSFILKDSTITRGSKTAVKIGGGDAAQILDLHLYHDGNVSILSRSGNLSLCLLQFDASLQATCTTSRNIRLAHVTPPAHCPTARPAAVVRLSASHLLIVLVATGGGPSNGRMAALIWDTDLEALLVASDWSIPTASTGLSDTDRQISVSAARVGRSQVMVHAEFWGVVMGERVSLAAVWALPFSIPEGSVLRHALGKAALTAAWTRGDDAAPSEAAPSTSPQSSLLDPRERDLVRELESLDNVADMETRFSAWISQETTRLQQVWEQQNKQQMERERIEGAAAEGDDEGDDGEESDSDDEGKVTEGGKDDNKDTAAPAAAAARLPRAPKPALSHSFVSALLAVALPPSSPSSSQHRRRPYVRKIVSYLVDRRSVSCGMLAGTEQSLLSRLRAHGDWPQIMSVVRTVTDLGEVELVDLLRVILRGGASASSSSSPPPALDAFLSQFITLAVSRPLLRATLHGHISDAKDVCVMLDTTTQWLKGRYYEPLEVDGFAEEERGENQQPQQPSASLSRRRKRLAQGRRRADGAAAGMITIAGVSAAKAPPTRDLALFAMDLVDVYFPLMLNTPSAHRSLRALSQAIGMHLSLCDELSQLRGPLDAYARLESDRRRVAEEVNRRMAAERFRDPRKARMATAAAAAAGTSSRAAEIGGGMQVPDLNKSARLRAYEASALVGPHTVEVLEV